MLFQRNQMQGTAGCHLHTDGRTHPVSGVNHQVGACKWCTRVVQALIPVEWTGIVDAGRKCTLYKHIKTDFKLELYLLRLSCDTYRYIVKLRYSNHKLAIKMGRYSGINRNLRYCDLCGLDILGDEYHTFFGCTKPEIVSLRKRFIPLHYSQQPSMFKFVKLLSYLLDIVKLFSLYIIQWLSLYLVYIMFLYIFCMNSFICVDRALQNSSFYTICNFCVCIAYLCILCFACTKGQ